ncbi:hypothetical protein RCOM_0422820 [Ricinus communis]|uniref:Cation transporter n=1 Tax=Ricinus communis TaxID=3988 RepID=B9SDN6_RICCO|nr:hypothetical protein RCOM_0422820 [Ricinus communis]
MEVFSNSQLVILTVLMFVGGEVFTSLVGLLFRKSQLRRKWISNVGLVSSVRSDTDGTYKMQTKQGILLVLVYLASVKSARNVLETKGLNIFTFSLFTIVSTFASCGFVPTNENMMVFSKNSGLLLILIPQFVLFCSLEWNSEALNGLNSFQKIIGVLFQTVNSRHTGETIVDLSAISPAILYTKQWCMREKLSRNARKVTFPVRTCKSSKYLPPYTAFLPIKDDTEIDGRSKRWRGKLLENIIFSQLSYLVIFVILICITERHKMKQDPLNFNVLNIVLEVISAYGNVGFTAGYSCKRQIHPDSICQDKWYGFSGRWSDEGRVILIMVMFFGRLKKFNMNGGRAWILL